MNFLSARHGKRLAIAVMGAWILVFSCLPQVAKAQGGNVKVKVRAFYTHDVENGGEEWTFEVHVTPRFGSQSPTTVFTRNGDSDPNFIAHRDVPDKVIFDQDFPNELPESLYIRQDGWENDRGGRTVFNCCSAWKNDDDNYGPGGVHVPVRGLADGSYIYVFPALPGGSGRKHGISFEVIITNAEAPASRPCSDTIFESATLGPSGTSGYGVGVLDYHGVRFELSETASVDAIGGHFLAADPGNIFGAIVRLTGPSDMPDSVDLSTPDVLAHAILSPPTPSGDVSSSLTAQLEPGWYALVFGSGLFGATGSATARLQNTTLDGQIILTTSRHDPLRWVIQGTMGWDHQRRLFITGTVHP
jgi:hypothetical protein